MPKVADEHGEANRREFTRRFRLFRNLLQLSRSQIARELELPENTVFRWETEKSTPSFSALKRIYALAERHGIWPQLFLNHDRVFYLQAKRGLDDSVQPLYVNLIIETVARGVPAVLEVLRDHDATPLRMEASQPDGPNSHTGLLRLAFTLQDASDKPHVDRDLLNAEGVLEVSYPVV